MKVHNKLHTVSLISAALILVLIIVSSTASAATTNSSVVGTDYRYEDWGQYPIIDIFGEKYVTLLEENNQIWQSHVNMLAKPVIDSKDSYNLITGEVLDLGEGYSLKAKQVDVDGEKVWLELDKDGEYVDDRIISIDSGDDTWNCTLNNIQTVNNITVLKVHINQVFQGATGSIVQIDGIWLIDYSNAIKLQIGDQFGDYTLKTIINGTNSSNLGSLVFESANDSVVYAYITNTSSNHGSDNVSVIDTATDKVIATVELAETASGVAVSPDGKKVYVIKSFPGNVNVINTTTNTCEATVSIAQDIYGVAVAPNGKRVYVTECDDIYSHIYFIDTATNGAGILLKIQSCSIGVDVSPDSETIYVAVTGSDEVAIIDIITNNITATVPVGRSPLGVAVSPDGAKVYVTNKGSNTVSVIDTKTNNATATVPVGTYPYGIAITPDGTKVYVTNCYSNNVSVIGTATNTVTKSVNVGEYPTGVAVTPDGKKVYVTNGGSDNISVIDTATNNVTKSVDVGEKPSAFGKFIGSVPVLKPVLPVSNFNSNVTQGYVPLTVQFTDLSTNATVWNWDFGDGNNSTDKNTTHTYSAAGNYTVNLTVSNANSTDSKLATITVLERPVPPITAFSAFPTFGVKPFEVSFKDKSTGSPNSWFWTFGDGNNSTVQNPVHIYEKSGRFTVSLTVKNAIDEDTRTRYNYIVVL